MSHTNPVTLARQDLQVLKILVDNDGPITTPTLAAVWKWFLDVEIPLPIPVLPLSENERRTFARSITSEMDEVFAQLEQEADHSGGITTTSGPQVDRINTLWRELAGCFAETLNATVPQLPEEQKREMEANAVRLVAMSTGMDEEDAAEHIKSDPVTRTMLRRSGIEPDNVPFDLL